MTIIPLPQPRPTIPAPDQATAEPPVPSACQLRLTADIAVIEPLRRSPAQTAAASTTRCGYLP
jgi:hypothetical protein